MSDDDIIKAMHAYGGGFVRGRHVQGAALERDYEKLNEAALRGWVVLQVVPAQVTDGTLTTLLSRYFVTLWPVRFTKGRSS